MYRYLFDNNIYRKLSTSKDGLALKNFNDSLGEIELLNRISTGDFTYKLTPFTIIEALGIKVPDFKLDIPNKLKNKNSIVELVIYVLTQSLEFYSSCGVFTKQHFMERANKQSQFTDASAISKRFEQTCIYDTFEYRDFEIYLCEYLAFDFLCKQDYPQNILLPIADYLLASNLYHCKVTGLSKYRLTKLLWRYITPQFESDISFGKNSFELFSKSMKLKTNEDYLDCEFIHLVCIGDYVINDFYPVVAFTCDNKDVIIRRLITYKSVNSIYASKITDEVRSKVEVVNDKWQPGIVVFCDDEGHIIDHVEVSSLPS